MKLTYLTVLEGVLICCAYALAAGCYFQVYKGLRQTRESLDRRLRALRDYTTKLKKKK